MSLAIGARPIALFDLDGCLVDSTPAITEALLHALLEAGLTGHRSEDLTWCVGPPLVDSVTKLLSEAEADVGLAPSIIDAYRARYRETSLERTEIIAGVPPLLERLREGGVRLGVVTSKPGPFARPLLDGLGLAPHFEAVHAPDADELLETKEVTLRRALDELAPSLPSSQATMIGDRSHDVVAGRSCRTRTIGVTWGAGSREELEQAGADHVVDTPAELAQALDAR